VKAAVEIEPTSNWLETELHRISGRLR
jgi:hypothetical protein